MKLTKEEINRRMIELRNLRKLHQAARERIGTLEAENTALKARVRELEQENAVLQGSVTDMQYQLKELQTMVFGKQKKARAVLEDDDDTDQTPPAARTKESYQRPIPKPEEITKTVHHRFPRDTHGHIRSRTYYIEDIPLSITKIVEKHVVEQSYDTTRRQWVSKDPLPAATVTLGDNVRVLIATLITVERLSYSQVQGLLISLFNFSVSSGEITKLLEREAVSLTPTRDTLLASIQAESSHHLDESRYDVKGATHYVWSITGGESTESVYLVGSSRGKGNAEALRGGSRGVLISDDYAAYRTIAQSHQLCWAHLIRHFRDLATHSDFTAAEVQRLRATYADIKAIYRDTRTACSGLDPGSQYDTLVRRLTRVATIDPADPKPVSRLKTTLRKNVAKYFTCLQFPHIALTNNTAERSLRHLVLKRKVSFGVGSHTGAGVMSVLFSVLLSLRRQDPQNYFQRYLELRRV